MKKNKSYQKELMQSLKDPSEAAAYLNAALEENDLQLFLLALRNVAKANGGIGKVSRKAHLNRENLYRALSKKGNPGLISLEAVLSAMDLRLKIQEKHA